MKMLRYVTAVVFILTVVCCLPLFAQDADAGLDELLRELDSTAGDDSALDALVGTPEVSADTEITGSKEVGDGTQENADNLTPEDIARQFIIKRQAAEEEGKSSLTNAQQAMQEGRFPKAVQAFSDALLKIPERPENDKIRIKAKEGLVAALCESAQGYVSHDDFNAAKDAISKAKVNLEAVSPEFRTEATKRIASIEKSMAKAEDKYAKANTPEAQEVRNLEVRNDGVDSLLDAGKEMLNRGEYDRAEIYFEQVLAIDKYNKAAMRFLNKIEEKRYDISTIKRMTTKNAMIQSVRDGWNPPIKAELRPATSVSGPTMSAKTSTQVLRQKMVDMIIPSIEFRQANIVDVISFLRDASEAADPDHYGINIILKLPRGVDSGGTDGSTTAAPPIDDAWGLDIGSTGGGNNGAAESGMSGLETIPTITLTLRKISLFDAIKFVTEVADLKYRLEENVVIITPANMVEGRVITRIYPVQPSFLDVVISTEKENNTRSGGSGGGEFIKLDSGDVKIDVTDVKDFFISAGVKFPVGTTITYNKSISRLIVSNTPENLEVFELILRQLDIIPHQVEIEARFVEVSQNDLEELGFEWLLTDNYEMLVKEGSGPVGGRERVVMNANSADGGFTRGMRFFGDSESGIAPQSPVSGAMKGLGGILGISSILTNPEVGMVLHALDQKGGTDLLSAPRVTTRSGVNAQIKVVREIIYPTEFDMQSSSVYTGGNTGVGATDRGRQTQVIVTPDGFETRETGVILNVTPTVGPDGYTIDLVMVPEVAELVDWLQYGTREYNIPQPVFSSRSVTTSIVIWDGQTVVMGGMIREELTTVDDKIPLLGDIPLLGHLFRNKGEYSKKHNLLIFVTARLVDPAGKRMRSAATVSDASI